VPPPVLPLSPAALVEAAMRLEEGRLVAFPTETVYGLAADATNDKAVAALYAAKGRPQFNPLIIHISDSSEVERLAETNEWAEALMLAFWPGPLTLVLPRLPTSPISLLATAGLDTIALRCPSHTGARQLIDAAGVPLAAPSANKSGLVSPTTAQHVAEGFNADEVALILAGRKSAIGVESTVVDLTGPRPMLLRPGAVLLEDIERVLDCRVLTAEGNSNKPNAPGQLKSHYAPRLPVRLNVQIPNMGEAYIAFGPSMNAPFNLSPTGDLNEAAANLFALLREADQPKYSAISIAPIPNVGLGVAINDRLGRAAADRT